MNKKIRNNLVLLFAVSIWVISVAIFGSDVFAEVPVGKVMTGNYDGPSWSSTTPGSGTGYYGVSWMYFESQLGEGEEAVVDFRPDMSMNNWFDDGYNLQTSIGPSIPAECSRMVNGQRGGFWHLGRNYSAQYQWGIAYYSNAMFVHGYSFELRGQSTLDAEYTYEASSGSYGHIFTYNWGNVPYIDVPTGSIYQALYAGNRMIYKTNGLRDGAPDVVNDVKNPESAWYAFLKSYKYSTGKDYDKDYYPPDVWGFCWSPGMEDPEYYTSSKVKVDAGNGNVEEDDTGPSSMWAQANVPAGADKGEAKKVEKTAKVTISHNIYSSDKDEDGAQWRVSDRHIYASNGLQYTIDTVKAGNDGTIVTSKLTQQSGEYYVNNGSGYVSESIYNVTFKTKGTITICETIELVEKNKKTGACTVLEGGNEAVYFAKSNVAIGGGKQNKNYVTTEVTSYGEQSVSESNVKKNDKRFVYFSHNVYSNKNEEGVPVSINRTGFDGVNYTLVSSQTSCYSSWDGKVNFTTQTEVGEKMLYVGDPRSCSDGKYSYLVRDVYEIQFTAEKKAYNFCEELTIEGAKTKVCARIDTGGGITIPTSSCDSWRPSSYDQSGAEAAWTSVVAKIKNTTLGEDWSDDTYAKPTDKVDWIYCYFPGVQRAYNTQATDNHVWESPGSPDDSYSLTYQPLSAPFFGTWQNQFSLAALGNFSPAWSPWSYSYGAGNDSIVDVNRTYNVELGDPNNKAGDTLTGQITSGIPTYAGVSHNGSHSWACHWSPNDCGNCGSYSCNCVTTCSTGEDGKQSCSTACATCCHSCYKDICSHSEDYISNSRTNVPAVDDASVNIPYNFDNTASVNITESLVYAGETATINLFDVMVGTRYNGRTSGSYGAYATQVDDAMIKLVSYASTSNTGSALVGGSGKNYNICDVLGSSRYESCMEIDSDNGLLMNAPGSMGGFTEHYAGTFASDYSVYDTDAGKYFCVVAAVYPANSGSDTNLVASGSNSWYVSQPSCRIIAKRPSFQVRGGTVYSSDTISTSTSNKNNIRNNILAYTPTNSGTTVVFGSWGEQGVFSNGVVKGFASGAATGMTGSVEGINAEYCIFRVPISFANFFPASEPMCPNAEQIGGLEGETKRSGDSGIDTSTVNKKALVDYWWVANPVEVNVSNAYIGDGGDYIETTNLIKDKVRFTYKNGDLGLNSSVIKAGVTHVVRATGLITIKGNITYNDLDSYSALQYVPKLIIYGQQGININCGVTRVDALLISDGTVNTCSDATSDVNDRNRSNQLVINGVIAANKLVLGRTYGAGAGRASAIPAEILNYDTSAILWGRRTAESDEFETMTTVYQHELAPRY